MSLLHARKLANLTRDFHTLFTIYVAAKSGVLDSIAGGKFDEPKSGNKSVVVRSILEAGVASGLWNKSNIVTPFGREFTEADPNGFRAWMIGLVELQGKMLCLVPDLVLEAGSDETSFNFENTPKEEVGIAYAAEGMAKFLGFRCLGRIKQFKTDKCRVLDVGCGNGEYLIHLARENASLEGVGIEMSSTLAEIAGSRVAEFEPFSQRKTRRITIVEGDILKEKLELSNEYDICLLNFILHYFTKEDRVRLISRCASLLKNDGMLVILEPVLEDFGNKQRIEFATFNLNLFPQDTTFHGLPRLSELRSSLNACGLSIIRSIKPFPVGPPMCYVAKRR